MVDQISGLPERQASALLGELGLAEDPVTPDRLLAGIALVTLLADPSEASRVLVVVDDAQWLNPLAFAASVAYQSGNPAVQETLALLEEAAQPFLDPARTEHASAELLAHERREVGPGGDIQAVPRPRTKVSACRTAMG